ncbi:MAG: hypothetical protein Q7S98_02405, partial [Deltaproteobacteria bacterium]|nr:hypothetical protein [Deltaproteobacteria bacterium]
DRKIHEFQDELIPERCPVPGLIVGDTAMGSCVTSAHFQGFKWGQRKRLNQVLPVLQKVSRKFEEQFGRPGIVPFETYFMDENPKQVIVAMGPDAGTAYEVIRRSKEKVGLIVVRLLTPFPSALLREALHSVERVGVVNNAFHTESGHLTAMVSEALSGLPIEVHGFFAGLGGADVSIGSREKILSLLPQQKRGDRCFVHQGEVL